MPLRKPRTERVRNFPLILDSMSPYLLQLRRELRRLQVFGNEKYKKNWRAVPDIEPDSASSVTLTRDFDLNNSYTIESSCWGYTEPDTDATILHLKMR